MRMVVVCVLGICFTDAFSRTVVEAKEEGSDEGRRRAAE